MKKCRRHLRIFAGILSVCLFSVALFAQAPKVCAGQRYEPSEKLIALIERVEALERATRTYYKTAKTAAYASRFIRTGRYRDAQWEMMVGAIDPAYETAMLSFADLRAIDDFVALTDRAGCSYVIDFPHLMAVVDSGRDFAGWAGDLITLAAEIGSLSEAQQMIANEKSTFGASDLRSDIDALNLRVLAEQNGGSLARAMQTYYLEGGAEKAVTSFLLRETGLDEKELSIDAVEASFAVRIDSATCDRETLALANVYGVADSERLRYANRAFSTWLYRTYCGESVGHEQTVAFRIAPTCKQAGALYTVCRHCGEYEQQTLGVLQAHRFAETRIDPTESEPGVICRTCAVCGFCEETYFDSAAVGDLDLDGCLTAADRIQLRRGILGEQTLTHRQKRLADLTDDGMLDARDYLLCCAALSSVGAPKKD